MSNRWSVTPGLLLTATLTDRLGLEGLVNDNVWLGYEVPGAALPGRKVMSLVHGMLAGAAQIAETVLKGFRLIVRRSRLIGAQADLFPNWRHHCFVTNRTVPTHVADIDHRDHATIELLIRDLKDQKASSISPPAATKRTARGP